MKGVGESAGQKLKFGFFGGIVSELKKVAWPSRDEALRLTGIVLLVTVVISLVLWGIDTAFSKLVDSVLIG